MTGPSWATVSTLEQSRWRKTAAAHVAELPADLARLADRSTSITPDDARRLAAWCAERGLPLAVAGGGYAPRRRKRKR